jgi:hypothetical protein
MPPPILAGAALSFAIDGLDQSALALSLQRLSVTWAVSANAVCEADFGDWGATAGGLPDFLWSDGRVVRPGVKLTVRLGDETVFGGLVGAVESRLEGSETPTFSLRSRGHPPAGEIAGLPARTLRWGIELLRLESTVEGPGPARATGHAHGEATGDVAVGQGRLRPGRAIDIVGIGATFAGRHVLTTVGLRFDTSRGLDVEFTARRASSP